MFASRTVLYVGEQILLGKDGVTNLLYFALMLIEVRLYLPLPPLARDNPGFIPSLRDVAYA